MGIARWYRWEGENLLLKVRVQPRASKDEVAGSHGDSLKVRLTAPPVDGKANAHLVGLFSDIFSVPKSRVTLIKGAAGREKILRIVAPRALPPYISPRTGR